jgi:hypothetical protein
MPIQIGDSILDVKTILFINAFSPTTTCMYSLTTVVGIDIVICVDVDVVEEFNEIE